MQRKPGFPSSNCSIKMPDNIPLAAENVGLDDVSEQMRQRQQLINFGHSQWGFNNWSWALTKQDLDFVDFSNGKYAAGVAAFVSVTVKSLDIHRENVGYATSIATRKGSAIFQARKGSVTNALKETLLSFGGNVTTDLLELLESHKPEPNDPVALQHDQTQENNQNIINKTISDTKNINKIVRKDDIGEVHAQVQQARPHIVHAVKNVAPMPPVVPAPPPVAKTAPLPVTLPPAANKVPLPANQPRPPPQQPRPPSNPEPKTIENMTEVEMRAERKRRQRQAQEEFRLKQIQKQTDTCTIHETEKPNQSISDKQDLQKTGFDTFLMEIPTQDIMIEETGASADVEGTIKRKSPEPHSGGSCKKRPGVFRKLDII